MTCPKMTGRVYLCRYCGKYHQGVIRQRDALFAEKLVEKLDEGKEFEPAAIEAVQEVFESRGGHTMGERTAREKAARKLQHPMVREVFASLLERATTPKAGEEGEAITPLSLLRWRAKFLDGTVKEERIDPATGAIVRLAASPAIRMRALEGFEKYLFVEPAKQLNIDARTQNLHAVVGDAMTDGVPEMDATAVESVERPVLQPVEDDDEG